jgi:phage terminase large subunit GpA-like protein
MQPSANIARKETLLQTEQININQINPLFSPIEAIRWKPPARLNISDWTEKNRILSSDAEEKGPMRLRRTPYLRPIMDAFLDPDVLMVVIGKAAQIGLTEGMISVIGYYADQRPGPAMLILADQDTADYMAEIRLAPMFEQSPNLSHLVSNARIGKSKMLLDNGSSVYTGWASSVAKLASRPMQLLILDEIDKPGYYMTTSEASAISLAIERTKAWFNRKIGLLSTPTIDTGNITKELNSCDVIYDWHIACPYCKTFQPLRFFLKPASGFLDGVYWDENGDPQPLGSVVWEGGRHATPDQVAAAGYKCGTCEKIFNTVQKNIAVEKGKMVARKAPDFKPRKVGFQINRLYSLLGDAGDFAVIVDDWINCLDDPKKKQGFYNSTLGQEWAQTIIKSTEERILRARVDLDPQTVPAAAIALTAGVDPQKYGFWFVVRAWAKNYDSWLIHYGFLTNWDEVENLLFETRYPVDGYEGKTMPIWRACLDTGGGKGEHDFDPTMTEAAYVWLRANAIGRGCAVYGIKGATRPLAGKIHIGKVLDQTPSGKPLPGGIRLIHLNTDQLKDMYHYRIDNALEENPQGAYLHRETGLDYAKQILAEEKILNEKGLQEWIRIRRDNHYLDADCMAMVAADPEFVGGGINILHKIEAEQDKKIKAHIARKKAAKVKRNWRDYRPEYLNR